MLDMNEGIVPQTSMPDSFSLDLRHALKCLAQGTGSASTWFTG